MTDLKVKQLTCKICGDSFTFTTGEQEFYKDRGLAEPRRCPVCRRVKREEPRSERTKD
ncbi:zinc-ribbon domain containing protein [Chloroflexota bacterium]